MGMRSAERVCPSAPGPLAWHDPRDSGTSRRSESTAYEFPSGAARQRIHRRSIAQAHHDTFRCFGCGGSEDFAVGCCPDPDQSSRHGARRRAIAQIGPPSERELRCSTRRRPRPDSVPSMPVIHVCRRVGGARNDREDRHRHGQAPHRSGHFHRSMFDAMSTPLDDDAPGRETVKCSSWPRQYTGGYASKVCRSFLKDGSEPWSGRATRLSRRFGARSAGPRLRG